MSAFALALGWGLLAAMPVLAYADRVAAADRARALSGSSRPTRWSAVAARAARTVVGRVVVGLMGARRRRAARDAVRREVPVAVDLVGIAIAAGCTAEQAVALAARFSPSAVAAPLGRGLRVVGLGRPFTEGLVAISKAEPLLAPLAAVLTTAVTTGAPIGPALARVAGEVRADVRRRAESRARTVPVRLLFPLVFCALPAFALLTVVPVVLDNVPF